MSSMMETAKAFFTACEVGKGWEGCSAYCSPDATFAAQAEPLADVKTLRDFTEWMKNLLATLTGGTYELKQFAPDPSVASTIEKVEEPFLARSG